MAKETDDQPEARGWDAITAAFDALYPGQDNPAHFGSCPHPPLSDVELLYGISAYQASSPDLWHFVTYGFSELYEKESDDPDVSGWGFELTFRLPRAADEERPPIWSVNFLSNLGRYVRRTSNPFGVGHYMDLAGPILLGSDTAIRAITFVEDSQLGTIATPNGSLQFMQVIGLTMDEYHACGDWQSEKVMDVLRRQEPLLVTDLDRESVFADPRRAAELEAGIDSDGSRSECSFVTKAEWRKTGRAVRVTLGARAVETLLPKLRSRLAHGRRHALIGAKRSVNFVADDKAGWEADESALTVSLTPSLLQAMRDTLKPLRGEYRWPELKNFTLEVVPSEITDSTGKVIATVG